jgi:hypothetical protein
MLSACAIDDDAKMNDDINDDDAKISDRSGDDEFQIFSRVEITVITIGRVRVSKHRHMRQAQV